MLTLLRTILSAARGVLWKPERNSMKFFREKFFGGFFRALSEVCMVRQPAYLYEFGPFRLDAAERLLSRDSEAVPLSPKAFDLLLALVERPGAAARKKRVDEAGLARHVRRGGQSLLHHFTDPQGARRERGNLSRRFLSMATASSPRCGGSGPGRDLKRPGGLWAELEPVGGRCHWIRSST